jgi:serine/threonine protein kinase
VYETDSLIYLVTEYLSGGTLEDAFKNKINFTGKFIQDVIKDILSGLLYLDENCIMHRDIKPENVILREEDNKWVISDFGLAAKSN